MTEKKFARDLAVCGGPPAFAEPLHVGRPNIPDRDRLFARLTAILDRRILTNNGPCVREFEEKLSEMLGVRHCVAVCNATIALQLAVRALRLSGEVILPSFTFVATAHALAWEGLTPVFCDVDRRTHTIDPREVEPLITERTTALLGVHVWGRPCDVPALTKIADERKLALFFDAAHAVGCSFQGKMVGGFGKLEVLSFHATKVLNCFEGGAVTTNDDALAGELRLARNFGFAGVDRVESLGINGKMSEISAAMGLTSLESFPGVCSHNRRNYELYGELLADVPGIAFYAYDDAESHNCHYIVVECEGGEETLSRDELIAALERENVLARRYFYPGCHQMEPYRSMFPQAIFRLRNTRQLADRVLALPNGDSVSANDVRGVCAIMRLAEENADAVRRSLQGSPASARRLIPSSRSAWRRAREA